MGESGINITWITRSGSPETSQIILQAINDVNSTPFKFAAALKRFAYTGEKQ